jgi:hypothetical protein
MGGKRDYFRIARSVFGLPTTTIYGADQWWLSIGQNWQKVTLAFHPSLGSAISQVSHRP